MQEDAAGPRSPSRLASAKAYGKGEAPNLALFPCYLSAETSKGSPKIAATHVCGGRNAADQATHYFFKRMKQETHQREACTVKARIRFEGTIRKSKHLGRKM